MQLSHQYIILADPVLHAHQIVYSRLYISLYMNTATARKLISQSFDGRGIGASPFGPPVVDVCGVSEVLVLVDAGVSTEDIVEENTTGILELVITGAEVDIMLCEEFALDDVVDTGVPS
jgi:hypothetical protein